jgi:mannose-1-phosphate guanylyltransferase
LTDDESYRGCVAVAAAAAHAESLVMFGIVPTEPATGFGYIEAGERISNGTHKVARFVEKPARTDAEAMIATGKFFWNSGMFLFRADTFIAEAMQHVPEVVEAAARAVKSARVDLDFVRLDAEAFSASPDISVDYAVFERTNRSVVVPSDIVWSDLGSWDAVWKSAEKDAARNVVRGRALVSNTVESLVMSESVHVTVESLDDVAVIASNDAVFVGRLSAAQNVGALVKLLAADPETAHLTEQHLTSFRPWGGYTSLHMGERFQVKRLFVKPGKRLSLQKHHHRSEHWVVVRGTAEATVGETVHTLAENESIHIPVGSVHRLANPGKILLEVIEVQVGSYLGEDDIVRMDDEYGRL